MKQLSSTMRFGIAVVFTLPLAGEMLLMPWHIMLPGSRLIALVTTTVVMLVAAWPYWESAWAAFKQHNANMNTLVALGTGIAYFYSVFAFFVGLPVYFESAAFIAVFVLLGDMMEEKMHQRASTSLQKLLSLQVKDAVVLRDDKEVLLPLDQVKTGDLVQVKPGAKIPTDGVITAGTTTVNEAMVTGESMPITKQVGDSVIGTTINGNGSITVRVTKTGDETVLAQIVAMVKKAQTSHAPIQKLTDKIASIFVPAVLIAAIIVFVIWDVVLGVTAIQALLYAIAVIVIACPCALGLATPTALMVGTNRAAKLGVLLKNGEVLQKMTTVTTVVFDKTGTITTGQPVVTDIIGDDPQQVLQVAASLEKDSEHPLASAIMERAQADHVAVQAVTDFMAHSGQGVMARLNGKPALIGNAKLTKNLAMKSSFQDQLRKLQAQAKTVAIVGYAGQVIGLIAIQDTPQPQAQAAIAALKKQGMQTVMLTGDSHRVAQAIAQQVGIDEVLAEVSPNEKANQIAALRHQGVVAFVGDGINDAPALTMADVGIAMGSGTDIAIESGDVVLVHNDLYGVVKALAISRKTFSRIKLNLFWALIYNLIGIPIAAGLFARWGMTLSPELAGLAMAFSSVSVVTSSLLLNKTKIKLTE